MFSKSYVRTLQSSPINKSSNHSADRALKTIWTTLKKSCRKLKNKLMMYLWCRVRFSTLNTSSWSTTRMRGWMPNLWPVGCFIQRYKQVWALLHASSRGAVTGWIVKQCGTSLLTPRAQIPSIHSRETHQIWKFCCAQQTESQLKGSDRSALFFKLSLCDGLLPY